MTATNYIYPFAQGGGANVISTADYAASSITTTTAYVADSIAQSAYMGKAQRQTSAMAAGLGQFIVDNQSGSTDVTDDLSPATISSMLKDAVTFSFSGLLSTDGWVPLGGGLILQWGSATWVSTGGVNETTAVSFPTPFSTAVFSITVTPQGQATLAGGFSAIPDLELISTIGFSAVGRSNGTFTWSKNVDFSWMAIGK